MGVWDTGAGSAVMDKRDLQGGGDNDEAEAGLWLNAIDREVRGNDGGVGLWG